MNSQATLNYVSWTVDISQTVESIPNKMISCTKYVETPFLDRKQLNWAEINLPLNFYAVLRLLATIRLLHFSTIHLLHWQPLYHVDLITDRQIYSNYGTAREVCFAVISSQIWCLLTLLQEFNNGNPNIIHSWYH